VGNRGFSNENTLHKRGSGQGTKQNNGNEDETERGTGGGDIT